MPGPPPVGPFPGRDARDLQIIDPVLTQLARQFRPHGFAYNEICPTIPVEALSGQYPVYDKAYFFGDDVSNLITDREETPEIELSWSTNPYLCLDYGLKISITPRERQQASIQGGGAALRLEQSKTQFLMTRMAIRRERRLAEKLRKNTTTGGFLALGGAATEEFKSSTHIETDWKTAKLAVFQETGMTPNCAVVPYEAAYDMATNSTLREIWKYFVNNDAFIRLGADSNGEDIFLPRWFQGTRLIVPKGTLYNKNREGATFEASEIWGTSVRFLYVDPQAAWGVPSTVYQFQAPVVTGQGRAGSGPLIDRWRWPDPVKDYIRATECIDERVCAPELGYELTGCSAGTFT